MTIATLRALERLKYEFGREPARAKLPMLRRLERARLPTAAAIERLHELLCFLHAYPDDARVLALVRRLLAHFDRRPDLRRRRARLADSGIAGTATTYSFFAATAARLATSWPSLLSVVWDEVEQPELLDDQLQLWSLWAETPALDELDRDSRQWIDAMRGRATDAAFIVRRLLALHRDPFVFEHAYEALGLTLRLEPGPDTPSRTRARIDPPRVHWQVGPLQSRRPDLQLALAARPRSVRAVSAAEGARYVALAQDAMLTRQRDLDAFAYGDPRDVRLIEWEDGLQFAAIGLVPERRLLLEAVYGFLTLKNGVPIGYVLNSALYGSAEIAYNVFDSYRGGEAGHVYGRVLATVRHLFGVDSFTIYPYQLGDDNDEALQSGAWWFYQKLGFRARDRGVLALMRRELQRMQRRPQHRSSIPTLRRLARENVYYHQQRRRDDVIGLLPLGDVGAAVMRMLAARYGADRERAEQECAERAQRLLSVRDLRGWSAGERLWLRRWAPLLSVLPGVERWTAPQRRALLRVIRSKGGRRESDYVREFDAHGALRAAVRRLIRR